MEFSKILFASDLHGSNLVFRKLLSTAITNEVDALIIGGDLSGKTVTPIIKKTNSVYETDFLGVKRILYEEKDLNQLIDDISNSGSYPIIISKEEYIELQKEDNKLRINNDGFPNYNKLKQKIFENEINKHLKSWLELAEEKLKPKGIRFIIICGNDDSYELDDIISESSYAENPEKKILTICNNNQVIGDSSANITPFNCPRDLSEDVLENRLREKLKRITNFKSSIFVLHTPPFNSNLDNVIKLDTNLKPILIGGNPVIIPVGSKAVRKIIEEYQPLLALTGHIHESSGETTIGRTFCVNPGSEYSNGFMRAYLITFKGDEKKGHLLIKN